MVLTVVSVALSETSSAHGRRTPCFFFFKKHAFEQLKMSPKKKLKADRHTADVERGFSAQNLICTSQSSLTTENQDMLLTVEMEAPRDVEVSVSGM